MIRRRTGAACYLPLSFVMSAVDGLFIILSGADVVSGLLASEDVDGAVDDDVDGAVEDEVELLDVDDGGDAGLVALDGVDVDDVMSVLGVEVDVDDDLDGVTTGGVVDDVVFDSR